MLERAAWRALDAGDLQQASEHARHGLEVAPRFAELFSEGRTEDGLGAALAIVLMQEGRLDEARATAAPLCAGTQAGALQDMVRMNGLCAAQ